MKGGGALLPKVGGMMVLPELVLLFIFGSWVLGAFITFGSRLS